MIWMPMYIHVIFSYLAAVGFAVFLNSPKKTLYVAGSIGMISWVIYVLLMRINIDMMTSNFIAASIAALLSVSILVQGLMVIKLSSIQESQNKLYRIISESNLNQNKEV